jgi:transposase
VALALGVSRQTVRKFGSEPEVGAGAVEGLAKPPEWHSAVDWSAAGSEMAKGTTIKQLHQELAPEVTYASFRRRLLASAPRLIVATVRLEHKPGEQTQVDYCDGIPVVERTTGECKKTHLFCGVLPFSSYAFGEFAWSQKLPSFIASHERMWAFFGGVTPCVVIDNLKAGVKKSASLRSRYQSDLLRVRQPPRLRGAARSSHKPRDKACIEATIGAIQRGFFQEVRNQTFYTLPDLNAAFRLLRSAASCSARSTGGGASGGPCSALRDVVTDGYR